MLTTEHQLTTRVSELSIEENYTNLDIEEYEKDLTNVNKNNGYTFRYPQRWLESPSQNKAVGIRRLDITPTSHVLSLEIVIQNAYSLDIQIDLQIMSNNTLFEILSLMCNEVTKQTDSYYKLVYNYNNNGTLTFYCVKGLANINNEIEEEDTFEQMNFRMREIGTLTDRTDNIESFLKFLNQNTTSDDIKKLTEYSTTKTFDNVWDREYLEFHASFSDSKRRFIGIKGDFYEKPTVLYNAPTDGSTFNIKFTSDGKNSIYPKYCRFIIQLVFMYNYKKTIVL